MNEPATIQSSSPAPTPSGTAPAALPGASSPSQTSTSQTATSSSPPTRPEWVPETCWDAQKGLNAEAYGKHFGENVTPLLTAHAAEQVRRNALPQKPEEYKLDLPKDFTLPQGVEFKFDASKPEYAKFQQIAHKRGLDQDTVTELLGTYAETMVGNETLVAQARAREIEKLGANATARITALNQFFTGTLGEDGAKAIGSMMVTSNIVTNLEKLVAKFASQGAVSFRQDGRVPPPAPGRVSNEEYQNMSPGQKLDYARRFDQSQFATKAS